jgi:cell shape-determining protein MreC
MIPMIFILALYLEPIGSILENPYDFVEGIEEIDVKSLEELERELDRKKFRILEANPNER